MMDVFGFDYSLKSKTNGVNARQTEEDSTIKNKRIEKKSPQDDSSNDVLSSGTDSRMEEKPVKKVKYAKADITSSSDNRIRRDLDVADDKLDKVWFMSSFSWFR